MLPVSVSFDALLLLMGCWRTQARGLSTHRIRVARIEIEDRAAVSSSLPLADSTSQSTLVSSVLHD